MTSRKFDPARQDRVESKEEDMARGFKSPDEADSLTLMVHAVRRACGEVFSFSGAPIDSADDAASLQRTQHIDDEPVPPDVTNTIDYLEAGLDE